MESTSNINPSTSGDRVRHWRRVLRPIGWWIILVLVLFTIRTHQRLSDETRIKFGVSLAGREQMFGATASFDQRGIESGERISLGWHTFTVSHSKALPFTTNLFVWYGEHNFGVINLKRATGMLEVHADPPAEKISVRGPEFTLDLTNGSGVISSVPTDTYAVEVNYRHLYAGQEVTVLTNAPGRFSINPRFGAVQLTCNQTNASFHVLKPDGQILEAGEFPAIIRDVAEGNYKVVAWHHRNQQEQSILVKAGVTNDGGIQFLYGTALLGSEPSGVAVADTDGHAWGYTPLQIEELPVGHWQFHLTKDGYEPASVMLEIEVEKTNAFRTNLVSINYGKALKTAREYLAAANYEAAVDAARTALQAKPKDSEATVVLREAIGKGSLQRAEAAGKRGDFTAGIKNLELALIELPENEEAGQLLADFKRREPEQTERLQVERLERPRKVFDSLLSHYSDASLFEEHELKTPKPVKEVANAILNALKIKPGFQLTRQNSTIPETFTIEADQELSTYLATSAGRRKCLIVISRTRDDETVILFKVLEYKAEAVEKFSIGALIGTPVDVKYIPIHSLRIPKLSEKLQAQVKAGVSNVTERIQGAIN